MSVVSASEARQTLPAQLDLVERGEEVEITRHGKVVAVLIGPDALRSRRATDAWREAERIGSRLEAALAASLKTASIGPERAEELVEAARAARHRG